VKTVSIHLRRSITAKTCTEIILKVRKIEDDFWTEDLKTDDKE